MRKSALFHSSRTVKLALVPVVALGVVAFATPAHADDTTMVPPDPPVELNDVASLPDLVVEQAPVVAALTEPAGDGSAAAAATAIETQAPLPPDTVEMAANNAVATEAEPSSAAGDATEAVPAEAIPSAQVEPQSAVARPSSKPPATQYHPASTRYQPAEAVVGHAPRIERAEPRKTVRPKSRDTRTRGPRHAAKLVQIMSRICADSALGDLVIPVENAPSNSDWNVFQIGGCIVDPTGSDVPLEGVAAPSACTSEPQYQPSGEQYQPVDCANCIAVDGGACIALPSAPPVATSASPAGGPELGASIPSFPASPISPPIIAAVPPPAPAVQNSKTQPQKPRPARAARPARTDHVLGVASVTLSPRSNPATHPVPRVRHVEKEHATPSQGRTEIRGPTTRLEALEPRPERTASDAPSASSTSPWLVAAGVLLLFGLASLASAIMEGAGTVSPVLLRDLRLRATSRGLSKHPLGTRARRQQGIRYRD
jgi:hypothetical protein